MPILPADYLSLALKWLVHENEATRRSGVSRGYYAAFHLACAHLDRVLDLPLDASAHGLVCQVLRNVGDPEARECGDLLRTLRARRNDADYRLSSAEFEELSCKFDIVRIKSIAQKMANLPWAALTEAIHGYLSSTGRTDYLK